MTVTGHPDWLPAITVVDQPDLIWIVLNQTIPHTSAAIDVRRWSGFQLSIQYEAANAGPPANTGIVTLEWAMESAFTNIVARHTYEINSVLSTDCGRSVISDGMYGPFMRQVLTVGRGAASTFTAVMIGTNRPFERTRAYELASVNTRGMGTDRILFLFNENIAASTTVNRNVRLGPGPAMLHYSASNIAGPYNLKFHSPQMGNGAGDIWRILTFVAGAEDVLRLTLPRRCLTAELRNAHAVDAGTLRVSLVADDS